MKTEVPLLRSNQKLVSHVVHVWRAALGLSGAGYRKAQESLSVDERVRAERLASDNARKHYVAAHGILRVLLGTYLGQKPQALAFGTSSHGKPFLVKMREERDLRFNLSHSHGYALYAFALGREVGIDLELVRANVEALKLAERFFAASEYHTLRRLPTAKGRERFFRYWTCREAYLKAKGTGLAFPLTALEIDLDTASTTVRVTDHAAEPGSKSCLVKTLSLGAHFVGAVAAEGQDWEVCQGEWTESDFLGEGTAR